VTENKLLTSCGIFERVYFDQDKLIRVLIHGNAAATTETMCALGVCWAGWKYLAKTLFN
jgi:hypothetical protein